MNISRTTRALGAAGLLVIGIILSLSGQGTPGAQAAAGINKTFNFQGRLLTSTGAVVADGSYNMRFKIYQDGPGNVAGNTGGTLLWTELWQNAVASGSSSGITVKNGYFSANLGTFCAFSGGSCQGTSNTSIDFNQDTLWLSMDVAGTGTGTGPTYDGELLPMRRLASAVYSLQAENAGKLGGLTSSQFVQMAQGVQTDASTTNASIFVNKTGATADILDLQRGGADVLLINNAGQSLFRPTTDSQTALQVQKAGTTTTAFTVDTSNSRIGIGLNNPSYAVDAVGSVNGSVSIKVAGTDVCTTSGCTASAASAIQNQNGSQQTSANYWISGSGRADTSVLTPALDTASAGTLTVGAATATAVTITPATTIAGLVTAQSTINVSSTLTTASNYRLAVQGELDSSNTGTQTAVSVAEDFNPTGGSLTSVVGTNTAPRLAGSALNVADFSAMAGGIATTSGYTGTITYGAGLYVNGPTIAGSQLISNYRSILLDTVSANGGNTSGTITNTQLDLQGVSAAAGSGGTMNNTGVNLTQPSGTGGTTNNYGVYIQGAGAGSTNYSYYAVSSAPTYIGNAAQIKTSSATALRAQDGSSINTMTVDTSAGVVYLGDAQDLSGQLVLYNASNANTTAVKSGTTSTTYTTVLPAAIGSTSQCLSVASVSAPSQTLGYSGCAGGGGVTLQGTTPGTPDTGNANISGTLIAGTALKSPSLDVASAGTLSLGVTTATAIAMGGTSATTITVGQATASNTINIGNATTATGQTETVNIATAATGTGKATITIGNTNDGGSTTIQAGTGNINLTSAGGTIVKSSTNNAAAFQVQNAAGTNLVNVNTLTTDNNLWPNPSFEQNINGAVAKGSITLFNQEEVQVTAKYGERALKFRTSGSADAGAQFAYPFKGSTTYAVSMWLRRDASSVSNINIGRADNGSDTDCLTSQTVNTTWTQFTCSFTTGTTIGSSSHFYVKINNGVTNEIFVDGVTLVLGSTALSYSLPGSALQVEPYYNQATFNAQNTTEIQPWQVNPNPLPAARSRPAVATANGYAYVLGGGTGVDGASPTNTVYYAKANADGTLSSWTATNTLSQAVSGGGGAVINGYIYVIGGATGAVGSTDSALVQYAKLNADGTTGTWGTTTQLPTTRDVPMVSAANGAIQVIGGNSSGASLATTLYARPNPDGTINNWIAGNSLTANQESTQAVVANGFVYIVAGSNSNGNGDISVTQYAPLNSDGSMGTWLDPGNSIPAGRGSNATVALNGRLYTIGGWTTPGNMTTSVYSAMLSADGTYGLWQTSANPLPIVHATAAQAGVESHKALVINGYIYVIGGDDSVAANTRIFYTTGARLKVNGSVDLTSGARSLSDPSSGGQLTAGNTQVVGTLQVADNASFLRNAVVAGGLNVGGTANFASTTTSANAFQIQTSTGASAINVSTLTTDNNLWPNPNFEQSINGVAAHNTGTVSHDAVDLVAKFGYGSAKVVTGAVTDNGIEFRYPFKGSTTYAVSMWLRTSSGTSSNINIGRADNGSDTNCLTSQSVTTTWTRFTCSWTSGTTIGSVSSVYVKVNTASTATLYVDGLTLVLGSTPLNYALPGSALQVESYYSNLTLNSLNQGEIGPWQLNPNALAAARSRIAVTTANGYVYAAGGGTAVNGATPVSTVSYAKANGDGTLGAWTNTTSMVTAVAGAGATVVNGYIYVIGGATGAVGSTDTDLVQYARLNADGTTGTWGTTMVLPATRDAPAVTSANGAIQVVGGNLAGTTTATTLYARPNQDGTITAWTTGNSMATARENTQVAVSNGYIYAAGGSTSNATAETTAVEYAPLNSDGSIGTWVNLTTPVLPSARGRNGVVALNGNVYSIGGYIATGTATQTGVYYWPIIGTGALGNITTSGYPLQIANATAAQAGLQNGRAVVLNGYIYMIGGDNNSAVQATTYYTSGPRTKINGSLDLTSGVKTLSDTPSGGSLTAGNTQVVGTLNVAGDTTLNKQLTVNGGMTVGGPATFSSTTAGPAAFQVQNASSVAQVNVNTSTANNLIGNPSFETGSLNGWAIRTGATIDMFGTNLFGNDAMRFITNNVSGSGVEYRVGLKASTTYSFSFFGRRSASSSAAFSVGVNPNPPSESSATNDANCTTTPASVVFTTTYQQFSCTFTTGATIANTSNIYIKQTDTSGDTIYIDGVTLVQSSTPLTFSQNLMGAVLQVDTLSTNVTISGQKNMELQPWRQNPSLLSNTAGTAQPRSRAATVGHNGYVYILGGGTTGDGATPQTSVLYAKANADGTLGSWKDNTNTLGTAMSGGGAVVVNGYIYLVGGSTLGGSSVPASAAAVATVQYARLNADGSTGTWSTTTSFPSARYVPGVVAHNGYIYVVGGLNTSDTVQTQIYYAKVNTDGTISSWTTNGTTLASGRSAIQTVVVNGTLWVIGGINAAGGAEDDVYSFKLNTDGSATSRMESPTDMAVMPTAKSDHGVAVLNGTIYVMPGWNGSTIDNLTYGGYIFDNRTTDSWVTMTNAFPLATENTQAVTMNGYIYMIGGQTNATAAVATVYYTSQVRTQIAGSLDLVGIGGKNMAEGNSGGTLTAGNTSVVGTLQTADAASFNNNVTINGTLTVGGDVNIQTLTNSTTAFTVQTAAGAKVLVADTSSAVPALKVGGGDVGTNDTPALLVLDTKTGYASYSQVSDPTGIAGAMYYNSAIGAFRCYEVDHWRDCLQSVHTSYTYRNDLMSVSTGDGVAYNANGGGAYGMIAGETDHPGIGVLATTTGATALTDIVPLTGAAAMIRLGNNDYWRFEASTRIAAATGLSSAGERYIARLGFHNDVDTAGEGTNGCFFRYSDNVNSGKWQGVCRNNSTESVCDTTITVATNTWYKLAVVVNAAGSSVDFQTSGVSRCQITTNIPTASGRETNWGINLEKTIGTTNRELQLDYFAVEGQLGTSR